MNRADLRREMISMYEAAFGRWLRGLGVGLAIILGLYGCKPELPSEPGTVPLYDLSGEWSYNAFDMRMAGSPSGPACTIEGVVLTLGPWTRDGFFGRSSEGGMKCTGELSQFSGPLASYPIIDGGMVRTRQTADIAFSMSGSHASWRHEGFLSHDTVKVVERGDTIRRLVYTDTMTGHFRLRNGGVAFDGKFRAIRRTRSR